MKNGNMELTNQWMITIILKEESELTTMKFQAPHLKNQSQ